MTNIDEAVKILKEGGVVALPTETVYGLAGSINSQAAIQKIFQIKERPFFDPLIVHVSSIEQAKSCTHHWPKCFDILAKEFWPGPVTFVVPKNDSISETITSGLQTVGLRMPDHPLTLKIIQELHSPLAAPSANKFTKTSPTDYQHVKQEFPDLPVVDGGKCQVGIESTILGLENNKILIYRPGMLQKSDIEKTLKNHQLDIPVTYHESPIAPGHLKHHYMPKLPLILQIGNQLAKDHIPNNIFKNPLYWDIPDKPTMAARQLYSKMRELDKETHSCLIFKLKEEYLVQEDFSGIVNRLIKAASYTSPKNFSNKT